MIIDKKNRQFKKLRVSLLQNCNFSCAYCSPSGSKLVNTGKQTPVNEILENISRIHDIVGLESIRLTGGEPSLYKNLIELILGLKKLNIPRIALTTNGSRLKKSATSLKNSGLDSINVSL
ncbi:MAG: radical SAM protein, partial [Leptospiraceae bacterium]|nr:radical SAM protein [Leptospiraceae bacterium]